MLVHLSPRPRHPERVVVVGATGFVGGAVIRRLAQDGVPVLALGRGDVDLLEPGAAEHLRSLLRPTDALVAAAARAPVKNSAMLVDNMIMASALVQAAACPLSHVVNISSDAIYADSAGPLTEESSAAPDSLHGVMHLARELMFRESVNAPLAMLRPTLIYGPADPHNGYGPNRFRRQATRGEGIVLFGEGEERRDHVHIDDVAEIVVRVLYGKSVGRLNIATGSVHAFREIAERVVELSARANAITGTPRTSPMPHNGYRSFDIAACRAAFPDFSYTSLPDGLARSQAAA